MNGPNTVLCVEDDANDAFLLGVAFEEANHSSDLRVVSDGKQALDYLKGNSIYANRQKFPLPDIVLLDIKLPFLSGLEVLRWMRAQREHNTRIAIIFSASKHEQDIIDAYRSGANSYVCKPLTLEATMAFVRQLYSYWFALNEFAPADVFDPRPGNRIARWTWNRLTKDP